MQFTEIQIKWYKLLSLFQSLGAELDIPNYPYAGISSTGARKFKTVYITQPTLDTWLANESKIPHTERCQLQGEVKPVPDKGVESEKPGQE